MNLDHHILNRPITYEIGNTTPDLTVLRVYQTIESSTTYN